MLSILEAGTGQLPMLTDEARFVDLYQHCRPLLLKVVLKIVPDHDLAEELIQETFTRAWRGQVMRMHNPTGWLCTVASHLALDHVRSMRYRLTLSLDVPLDEHGHTGKDLLIDERPGFEEELVEWIPFEALLASLPRMQQEAIRLVMEDCSYEEIARVLDTTHSSAKMLVSRGRHTLKAALEGRQIMKTTRTGKPLCGMCRKLATYKQDYPQRNGTTITLYHCHAHRREGDVPLEVPR